MRKNHIRYILLDKEFKGDIQNCKRFIKYLDNTESSSNTIKTYCYHLKLFYEFMSQVESN
ncbi:site-specific integrase [Staphylococcus aureus]